mmetsp:Transcript_2843/g.11204  ORF Transcript_2843/g.11204 Transcript_2843/m.11204 type:complete len:189 (-) Transcript_2843:146-712(-)
MRTSIARRAAARVVSDFVSHAPSASGGAAAPSKGIKVINITPYAASEVTGGGGLPHARAGVSAQTKPSQLDKHWVNAFHKIHGRGFASSAAARAGLSPAETKKRMDEINDNFAEAREEIEAAMEAVGTTYFNEEAEYAKEVTEKTLGMYYELCEEMDPEERAATQRAMGMKMEQLKAELKQLDHAHDD